MDVAVAVVGVVVQVATTETCGADLDLEFIWGWWGQGTMFYTEVFGAVEDYGKGCG